MMHGLPGFSGCALALLVAAAPLEAADVFRCVDSNGHITFTQLGCPAEQVLEVQSAYNPSPGSGRPVAMANSTKRTTRHPARPRPAAELQVVAEKQDGCGNRVTGSQRRTAIIRKQIQAGMTRADVESALGKPDERTSRNGETRYTYADADGGSRQVSFDQSGCVKSKR
ncbi:DUF4124 domain-containing protein [Pseudomonas sp. N040]|uniref:DUF4124 domain-containing protein n=1 Tax=Pseudomonas sp. N040 TaxID=2785325 RepID=UPI0018A27A2F|nr:DUF4124 domain-containing protein [Pseudomonas sp. N040]MBF7729297.1 DUF4124 domain-containing protein [Pseudomonas sp. N040]MBW7012937.1 DUF4124 domain-containing protein [Pseudomonas sp. N040]